MGRRRLISGAALPVLVLALVLAGASRAGAQTQISQAGWTVQSVDSQDTCCGNAYLATKAIDGNASTFWHTVWSNGAPPPPHAIEINLGASHQINGFRYLPRQDGVPNGRIGQFEFYVRADGDVYGPPVATGALANIATQQEVSFAPKTGQFVMLVALTEVEGRPYTSMAELNVLEVSAPPASTDFYAVGTVNVQRGGGPVELWGAYSTKLGTPLALHPAPTIGDNAGGTFRFSCNDSTHLVCQVSVAAAALGTPGVNVLVYPRVLIHRQDYQGSQVSSYCEYGDGSVGVGPAAVVTQAPTLTPAFTSFPINLGGSYDCPGQPLAQPPPGSPTIDAATIIVGPGRYDVDVSFVFKKITPP